LVVRRALTTIERLSNPLSNNQDRVRHRNVGNTKSAPTIDTIDQLAQVVSRLSKTQKEILAEVLRFKDGVHVGELVEILEIKRAELIYRARDLEGDGLIEILHQTDQCFVLSEPLKRLFLKNDAEVRELLQQGTRKK
jgi:hypothetical protein